MLIHGHEVCDLDSECADYACNPPLEEQCAEEERPCEEAVEEFGAFAGQEPAEGREGVCDGEEAGHQGNGRDATEAHFGARGEGAPGPCFVGVGLLDHFVLVLAGVLDG